MEGEGLPIMGGPSLRIVEQLSTHQTYCSFNKLVEADTTAPEWRPSRDRHRNFLAPRCLRANRQTLVSTHDTPSRISSV